MVIALKDFSTCLPSSWGIRIAQFRKKSGNLSLRSLKNKKDCHAEPRFSISPIGPIWWDPETILNFIRTGFRMTRQGNFKYFWLGVKPSNLWQNGPLKPYFAIFSVQVVLDPVSETLSKTIKWRKESWSDFSRMNLWSVCNVSFVVRSDSHIVASFHF